MRLPITARDFALLACAVGVVLGEGDMGVKDNNVRIPIGCAFVTIAAMAGVVAYLLIRLNYHG